MSLSAELSTIAPQCNPSPQLVDELLEEITRNFSEKTRENDSVYKQNLLAEFHIKEGEYQILKLISMGDLLRRLQNWCDEVHGQGNFKVYYRITPLPHTSMEVWVSWGPPPSDRECDGIRYGTCDKFCVKGDLHVM